MSKRELVAVADRAEVLGQTRTLKMARSQHAYVRGSTVKFYEWLAESDGKVPTGPSIWICGDCHLGNLGPLADAKGKVEIQIRDLDQTVIGNPAHDIIRLALSLAAAARGFDLPGAATARMIEAIIAGYVEGLAGRDGANDDDQAAPIRKLLQVAGRRRWKHLAEERIEDIRPVIPLGSKYWPITKEERRLLSDLLASDTVARQWRSNAGGNDDTALELLDAAYWMKGCSSLGRLRYTVIARLGPDGSPALLDIKEATKAAAPRDEHAEMPRDNAMRVVTGARALSPHLGERMGAGRLGSTAVVIRELMPQDLKTELDELTADEAREVARSLASVVGRAHGRQLDNHQRTEWAAELTRQRSKSLDAPTWLWSSVVDLVGIHKSAYLDHCRRALLAA
ncbi:DUF2252 domain-containing protein (plasmid) [Polymorphobacter sp. PAMC 29334]|uniref:DUF2252 family protein n=1 Tax=Polymorphobacter sp. PAMC 29334 TaxID=2862331 RepID=UPI001C684FF4|nr:DUF2252 family protein [Polymorphobacter sp. PAMC 29334]QYE33175.1 DUF2252 domain-containing protein [Polymorphobacter sp. PAMC 29334]